MTGKGLETTSEVSAAVNPIKNRIDDNPIKGTMVDSAADRGAHSDDRRVAVVVIHGVADQPPASSARAIADLLLRGRDENKGTRYTPFTEQAVRIAVAPLRCHETARTNEDAGLRFTRKLLHGHERAKPRDAVYETVCLMGSRLSEGQKPPCHVHIYESYWADQSRLAGGLLRIFNELFFLLFRVSHLGRYTVEQACAAHGKGVWWRAYRMCQNTASRLLTDVLPFLLWCLLLPLPLLLLGARRNERATGNCDSGPSPPAGRAAQPLLA